MNLPETVSRPALVASAVLASLGPLVGNALYSGPAATGAGLQRGLAHPTTTAHLGHALELVGFVALAVLFAALCVWTAPRAPVSAAVAGLAGAAGLAVKVGSVAPLLAVAVADDALEPATVDTLVAIGDTSFVVFGFLVGVGFCAAGLGLLRTAAPRWLGWWATGSGALTALAGGAGVLAPERYVFVPLLTLFLWMLALGCTAALGRPSAAVHPTRVAVVPE